MIRLLYCTNSVGGWSRRATCLCLYACFAFVMCAQHPYPMLDGSFSRPSISCSGVQTKVWDGATSAEQPVIGYVGFRFRIAKQLPIPIATSTASMHCRFKIFIELLFFRLVWDWKHQDGIALGVAGSLAWLVKQSSRPFWAVLGRLPNTTYYRNVRTYKVRSLKAQTGSAGPLLESKRDRT